MRWLSAISAHERDQIYCNDWKIELNLIGSIRCIFVVLKIFAKQNWMHFSSKCLNRMIFFVPTLGPYHPKAFGQVYKQARITAILFTHCVSFIYSHPQWSIFPASIIWNTSNYITLMRVHCKWAISFCHMNMQVVRCTPIKSLSSQTNGSWAAVAVIYRTFLYHKHMANKHIVLFGMQTLENRAPFGWLSQGVVHYLR